MKTKIGLLVSVALLALVACDSGDGLTVTLDPDFRLLRMGVPVPERFQPSEGDALMGELRGWGRGAWLPDAARWFVPEGIRALPVRSASVDVEIGLEPSLGSIQGRAVVTLTAEDGDIEQARFYLSADDIDMLQAVDGPEAAYSYEAPVLTVTPASPVLQGQNWTLEVRWHDVDVKVVVDDFPERGGAVMANLIDSDVSFFSYGYYFWPRLRGQSRFEGLSFNVTHPDDLTLVMSGEFVGSSDNGDSTLTAEWRIPHSSEGYIGLALGDFDLAEGTCGDAALEVYGLPGMSLDGYPIAVETYVPVLEAMCADYQSRFGAVAFDVVRFVGVHEEFNSGYATEGLVLVPNYIWDDDGSGSFIQRDFYLAHELSHQWWGNDVTIDDTRDWWLVEGMADYCACSCLERVQGEAAGRWVWQWEVQELLTYYDEGGEDHALVPDESIPMELRIVYIKGAWVLRMLEGVMGTAAMDQLLLELREEHRFAALATQTLVDKAALIADRDLDWFFEQWLYGQGLMNLDEAHEVVGDQVLLTISQQSVWKGNPPEYFQMPVEILLEKKDLSRRHEVEVLLSEEEFPLSMP